MSAMLLLTLLAAPPAPADALAWFGREVPAAILEYQSWDLAHRGGRGDSDAQTSGDLGWGESTFLRNYVSCYRVTGDPYWLDKFIDHFDRMLASQHDRNRDGFLAWDSIRFSVGIVTVRPPREGGPLSLTPASNRINVTTGGERITGRSYAVLMPTADSVRIIDLDRKDVVLGDTPYAGLLVLDPFGGAAYPSEAAAKEAKAYGYLVLRGPGQANAQFTVDSIAPEWLEFVVHDGMIAHPMAQFVELVMAYLVLQAVDAIEPALRDDYRAKAVAMLTYFKRHLREGLDGRAYVWNYWDPPAGQEVRRNAEDYSHATIDVGAVVEAAQRGLVFGADDVVKIARTFTDLMSGGDPASDLVTARVDGQGAASHRASWEWVRTGLYDAAAFRKGLRAGAAVPTICEMLYELGAVTDADRRQARANTAQLQALLANAEAGNPSFEFGVGEQIVGWKYATWSADAGAGTMQWSTDAIDGQRSVALTGTSGTPNLVLEMSPLEVTGPTRITISLQYKTEAEAKASLSFIADVPDGERQYDSSPRLERSETWRKASWTFTTRPGVTLGRLYLRNGGLGTVWYDALTVTREPVP